MDFTYKILFGIGVLYTFVSFIISGLSGAFHFGSHLGHLDGHMGGYGHLGDNPAGHTGDVNGHNAHTVNQSGGQSGNFLSSISFLINPTVVVSFLTVFGGIGILGTNYFKWVVVQVFLIALISGVIISFLLYRFIAVPLYRSENSTDVSREDLIGIAAEVSSEILENGFGKIAYTVNSIKYTAPAKHIENKEVKQGAEVFICKIENNVFYVKEINI